jgi:hypothetical protein
MTLQDKIISLYPSIKYSDFDYYFGGNIALQNDGNGEYIRYWDNPIYVKPTDEQLASIK